MEVSSTYEENIKQTGRDVITTVHDYTHGDMFLAYFG